MEGSEAHCWFIGVDGCKAGWFYVASNGQQYYFGVVSNIPELITQFENIGKIVIDIPIGLHDKGDMPRACDVMARQKLKPRGSTVFPAPVRPCLYAHDYREACEISHTLTGKKLSQQAFNILKKIREVDEILITKPELRALIKEAHPELGFCMLNHGYPLLTKKKRSDGINERLQLLVRQKTYCEQIYNEALVEYPRKILARDDIVDAMMCLLIAVSPERYQRTLPDTADVDDSGLEMAMQYILPI